MHIKITARYHFTFTGIYIIKKWKTTSVGGDVAKLKPLYVVSWNVKYSLSSKAAGVPERSGVSSNRLLSIRPYQDTLSVLDQELLTDVWTSQNLGARMKSFIRISYTLAGPHFPSR